MNIKKKNVVKQGLEGKKKMDAPKGKVQNIYPFLKNKNGNKQEKKEKNDKKNTKQNDYNNTKVENIPSDKIEDTAHVDKRKNTTLTNFEYSNDTQKSFENNQKDVTIDVDTFQENIENDMLHLLDKKGNENDTSTINDSVDMINNSLSTIKSNIANLKGIINSKDKYNKNVEEGEVKHESEGEGEGEGKGKGEGKGEGEEADENEEEMMIETNSSGDNLSSDKSSIVMTFENPKEDNSVENKTEEEINSLLKTVINTKLEDTKYSTLEIVDECLSIGNTYSTKKNSPNKNNINSNITNITNRNVAKTDKSDLSNNWLKQNSETQQKILNDQDNNNSVKTCYNEETENALKRNVEKNTKFLQKEKIKSNNTNTTLDDEFYISSKNNIDKIEKGTIQNLETLENSKHKKELNNNSLNKEQDEKGKTKNYFEKGKDLCFEEKNQDKKGIVSFIKEFFYRNFFFIKCNKTLKVLALINFIIISLLSSQFVFIIAKRLSNQEMFDQDL